VNGEVKMKKIAVLTVALLLGLGGFSTACELIVRVPVSNAYLPYFNRHQNGDWGGLSVELAQALLADAGCKPVYKPLPFPRALKSLKAGKIDLMLNLTATDERREFTHFIGPQLDETVVLVVRKDSGINMISLNGLRNLAKPIGVERGKVYGPAFEKMRASDDQFRERLEEVTEVNLLESMLEKNRISGFLGYGYNVYHKIKTDPSYVNFKVTPYPIHTDWVYFGFSKKSVPPETVIRLQASYNRLYEQGVFKTIIQKYRIQ